MEDRIKNLSLDQKAKLYYMMLLRKGVIDTLPEDPKAAYVQSMMDEPASSKFSEPMGETNDPEDDEEQAEYDKGWYGESLKETATKLGYLKEDYKPSHRAYDVIDKSNNDEIVAKKLPMWKALEISKTNPNYKINATDRLAEESNQYQKASFVYTEQGGHFYSLTLSTSDGQTLKMKYDEANEWVKGVLEYIHEGDLIPRRYNSGLEDLDLIVARLEELGIEASHGDYMDVS